MKRAILLATLLLGCSVDPTQVIVHVYADPGVAGMTESLGIRIWGRAGDMGFVDDILLTETADLPSPYPWVVALRPLDDDASRFFRVEASAYDDVDGTGEVIAQARLATGYVEGRVLHVHLLLQDSCIGVICPNLATTCVWGRCVEIPNPPPFDPDGGFPDAGMRPDSGFDPCTVPRPETCNGEDDDCDGMTDEGIDLSSDLMNCGACGDVCRAPRGTPECVAGECGIAFCDEGWGDCDAVVPGCETPLTGRDNCGSCDHTCTGALLCDVVRGCVSTCTPPEINCGGSCVDLDTSVMHCGSCDALCPEHPGTDESCGGGACRYTCLPGRGDCNGDDGGSDPDGCEVDLRTDLGRCGTCDVICTPVVCNNVSCIMGTCRMMPNDLLSCSDGDACTTDECRGGSCIPTGSCGVDSGMPECGVDSDCPDMGPCSDDTCTAGVCSHVPIPSILCCTTDLDCDDFNACTIDTCGAGNTCTNMTMGSCTPCFVAPDCDDMMACTADTCVAGRCEHSPEGTGCFECGADPDPCFGRCCLDMGDYCCPSATDQCCGGFCCAVGSECFEGSCRPADSCDGGICSSDAGIDGAMFDGSGDTDGGTSTAI